MAETANTLVRHARLLDPASGTDRVCDLLAGGGRVLGAADEITHAQAAALARSAGAETGIAEIDAHGLWLAPGLVDAHVHLREPGLTEKETIRSGSLAAAAGGYTSLVCEPNTVPPIHSVEVVSQVCDIARREAAVNVYMKAAMTAGRLGLKVNDLAALADLEAVVALSDDGDPVVSCETMDAVCRRAARYGMLLTPHCEDSPRSLDQIAAGIDPGFRPGAPYANEARYVKRDLGLARRNGCRIHFSHVSLARTCELLAAESKGIVTFEVAPHHMLLSAEDFPSGKVPLVNPPLRSKLDRDAVAESLQNGSADVVASDHAPHTSADKAAGASGFIGLEATLGLILTYFVHSGKMSPSEAVLAMSPSPARIFGLPAGDLRTGAPADMVLIDPEAEWTVEPTRFHSKARNCPFAGWQLKGMAVATFVGGRRVWSHESFTGRMGAAEDAGS
jgi:dihydroorotase